MEKQRGIKTLSIIVLLVCVICLTVGFATLSRVLRINGVATVKSWNVHFENFDSNDVAKFYTEDSTNVIDRSGSIVLTPTELSDIEIEFDETGDNAIGYYTFKIVNEGSTNSVITNITYGLNGSYYSLEYGQSGLTPPSDYNDVIDTFGTKQNFSDSLLQYKLFYGNASSSNPDGAQVKQGDVLQKNGTYYVYLKIYLNSPSINSNVSPIEDDLAFTNLRVGVNFSQTGSAATVEADTSSS